ncbi:MAG: LPS export ABC transporter periplasmic protein LptC, partial [Gammaproteobacteria bacterium TMED139]
MPIVCFVTLTLGLTLFGKRKSDYPESEKALKPNTVDIDTYAEGINSIFYDQNGVVSYTLRAENQIHFKNGYTKIEKPLIRLFQNEMPRWNIEANQGHISNSENDSTSGLKRKNLELSGSVQILGLDEFGNRMLISTEFLEVDPMNEILKTDQRVEYKMANIQHSAAGMIANLQDEEIIFREDVRGSYEKA